MENGDLDLASDAKYSTVGIPCTKTCRLFPTTTQSKEGRQPAGHSQREASRRQVKMMDPQQLLAFEHGSVPRPPQLHSSMNNSTLDPGDREAPRRGRKEVAPPVEGELDATSLKPTTPVAHVKNFTSLNASMAVPNERGRRAVNGGTDELNATSLEPSTPMPYVTNFTSLNQSMVVPNQRGRREVSGGKDELDPTSLIPRTNELQLTAPVDRTTANVSALRSAAVLPAQAPPVLRGRYIAAEAHAVHSAGNGAAHITGGKQHVPPPSTTSWAEMPDGAGHSSLHAARHKTNANRHFFGEPIEGVVPGGPPAEYHQIKQSQQGINHRRGHFDGASYGKFRDPNEDKIPESGGVAREVPELLRYCSDELRRGRKSVPVPGENPEPARGGRRSLPVPGQDLEPTFTPRGRRQTDAHRQTFDGSVKSIIYGTG